MVCVEEGSHPWHCDRLDLGLRFIYIEYEEFDIEFGCLPDNGGGEVGDLAEGQG